MAEQSRSNVDSLLRVEVVFALPHEQRLVEILVAKGTTCGVAVSQSGIAEKFADVRTLEMPLAVWGRPVTYDERVKDGDRIEILRPLEIDPRDARRQLAETGQFMGGPEQGGRTDD